MKLTLELLLIKFPFLHKFKDEEWFINQSMRYDCNNKELPLHIAFLLISDMLKFIEETKFNSRWEEGFSLKIRLQHMQDLLFFFCEDTEEEKTIKGSLLK